jgi:hypothetical protein
MGAISSLIERRDAVNRKHAVLDQLQRVANDPTDGNAIGALSAGGVYGMQSASNHEIYDALRNVSHQLSGQDFLRGQIQKHFDMVQAQTPQVQ